MRITSLLMVPLLAAAIAAPTPAPAQGITITFGARLGPEIGVYAYSNDRLGDWHKTYRQWTPVTLYDINGRYYRTNVRGSRPVLVYMYHNEYFLPPQDQGFNGIDKRYDYRRGPTQADYGRAQPYTPGGWTYDVRLGTEFGVLGYSSERAGDWRANMRRWTPVTLYESHGHYYQKMAPGARPVMMYRYQNEYFLPPTDQAWVGADKRYNYARQPNSDDRARVRGRP